MDRLPYNAKNTIILNLDGRILAVWTPDPAIAAQIKAADNDTLDRLIYSRDSDVEIVATARRFYKQDGAAFSGWIVEGAGPHSYSDPIPNKHDAMRALRHDVTAYFEKRG